MRILHLLAPAPIGGAERVVLDLTRLLAQGGVSTHIGAVVDAHDSHHPFLAQVDPGVRLYPIPLPPRAYMEEWRQVRRLIHEVAPTVVHTHGYRADVVGGAAARRSGVPVVSTVHGFTGGGGRNRIYEWLQRRALRRVDGVIAVSRPLADQLAKQGIRSDRIHEVPNARPLPPHLPAPSDARHAAGVPEGSFHLGWVGRMSREKAPDVMLGAVRKLFLLEDGMDAGGGDVSPSPSRPFFVTFIGDGPERSAVEERAQAWGLGGRVQCLGSVPDATALMTGLDTLVLSSRTEGTPIVALEAMGMGIPLVATRVGGVPNLTGEDGAVLVPTEDPDALAQALRGLRDDPERRRRQVRRAQLRVEEVASPQVWVRRHRQIYSGIQTPAGDGDNR